MRLDRPMRPLKVGDVVYLGEEQSDGKCEVCGEMAELRPYGRDGANVCFPCGMKDEDEALRRFAAILNGPNEPVQ